MEHYYCNDRGTLMLMRILKENHIRKIIASPGTGNMAFVGSAQQDPYFEIYSCVDERSAGYMACGMAWESLEPVVLTCTGATASRNYLPALTEAYYRKLPIIAVTASQHSCNKGHLITQYIDRSVHPADAVGLSVQIQAIKDKEDEWDCNIKLNQAVLEALKCRKPIHINMESRYDVRFDVRKLPDTRIIKRFYGAGNVPELHMGLVIGIAAGAHTRFSSGLTEAVDLFCERYNAAVFCDHASGYYGKYKVLPALIAAQEYHKSGIFDMDILIHIGEQFGDLYTYGELKRAKEVWRVSPDGELRDTFGKLKYVFQMDEQSFFECYGEKAGNRQETNSYYRQCVKEQKELSESMPELPMSNIWIARNSAGIVPANSTVYFSILNTLRSWDFFVLGGGVESFSNVGGFGIDGGVSSLLGASYASPDKLFFCIVGDLQFFYDMNALGNRHLKSNVRILLVNNGKGSEFRLYTHGADQMLGDDADEFIAAKGHYGKQSRLVVKNFIEPLGFEYLSAGSKEEFMKNREQFFMPGNREKPLLFEVFTDSADESKALQMVRNIRHDAGNKAFSIVKEKVKDTVKKGLGDAGVDFAKSIMHGGDRK